MILLCFNLFAAFLRPNTDHLIMAKPVLPELQFFVNCVSKNHRNLPADVSTKLVKCSLHLLEHLPASREAVLEYFASVFDVSVGNYIQFVEVSSGN